MANVLNIAVFWIKAFNFEGAHYYINFASNSNFILNNSDNDINIILHSA